MNQGLIYEIHVYKEIIIEVQNLNQICFLILNIVIRYFLTLEGLEIPPQLKICHSVCLL